MGMGSVGTHAYNQTLYKKPHYDASADFTPVALIAETPVTLITRKDLPPPNFKEFIAYTAVTSRSRCMGPARAVAQSEPHRFASLTRAAVALSTRNIIPRAPGGASSCASMHIGACALDRAVLTILVNRSAASLQARVNSYAPGTA
jgi:hypothetical protein